MAKETIKYTIRQDGNVTQEVFNVSGDACLNLTEDIEIKLGDLENRVYTADYYQQNINLDQDITINTNTDVTF
jgi:hypothetical protein|tara:strand:- start:831 stop:1049 length:219 start_codon:yes stop_codon:yes gene_type:complete